MKLYLVHCGYYDSEVCDGLYEGHVNYFIAAESFDEAKIKVKFIEEFKKKKMHVDGMQEIQSVDGFKLDLQMDKTLQGQTKIINFKYRELAPQGKSL